MYLYGSSSKNVDVLLSCLESNLHNFRYYGFRIDLIKRHVDSDSIDFAWLEIDVFPLSNFLTDNDIKISLLSFLLTECLNSLNPISI